MLLVLQDFFRVSPGHSDSAFIGAANLLMALPNSHWPTIVVGLSSFAMMMKLKYHPKTKKYPCSLLVVLLGIIVIRVWNAIIDSTGME